MRMKSRVAAVIVGVAAALLPGAGTSSADPVDFGGNCVFPDPANRPAAVDTLRFGCDDRQREAMYRAAEPGAVPGGAMNGWAVNPTQIIPIAPAFWTGKNFYPGFVRNRVTAANIEGFTGLLYIGPSRIDGKPSWVIDYVPSIIPFVRDEMREVLPGIYLGSAWIKDGPDVAVFILA